MRAVNFVFAGLITVSTAAAGQSQPAKSPPIGCDTAESHQWDFWVGQWEVHPNGAATIIAHSLIEKRYSGCAIRENWMPLGKEVSGGGGSLSLYDARLKLWRQTWIDSTGVRVDLDGGFKDGVMVIAGKAGGFGGLSQNDLVRMSYQVQPDGQVRQWGEASSDNGKTWQPTFDFLYRRVAQFPRF